MSTDKTWFDEKLKTNLYLDICLRVATWLVVAFLTIAYASNELGFTPVVPLQKSFSSLMPVIVDVTRVAIVLCLFALLLKDLEHASPESWGQETGIGKIGGVVRRLAGDLSLWIIGALVATLHPYSISRISLTCTANGQLVSQTSRPSLSWRYR